MNDFIKNHDLRLPDWGPYSKRYAGISHISEVSRGLRFDLSIIPGRYRGQMLVPNEKWASGHHAWEAATDLSYYAYRYELEWKDQVYCDVSFSAISNQASLVRCAFVNNTNLPQNLMLHLVAYLNFPPVRTDSEEAIKLMKVSMPNGGIWKDALDYEDLGFANPRPTDNLNLDGMMRAEIRDHGLVNGNGIGCGFGEDPGDWVRFQIKMQDPMQNAALTFRYRINGPELAQFHLNGMTETEVNFLKNGRDEFGFSQLTVPVGALKLGLHTLHLTSSGNTGIELDGFALTETDQVNALQFETHQWTYEPEIIPGPHPTSLILKYADTATTYGIAWDHPDFWIRQYFHDELDILLRHLVPNNYSEVVHGAGEGHFTDVFMRPISMTPHSETVVYGFICSGSQEQVVDLLSDFAEQSINSKAETYTAARQNAISMDSLPSGETYRFSQERMAATELLNVVYPVYTRRQYIRHSTPGKWWDSLYTWDSGFIGLALLELDLERAIDNLNAYVTLPDDPHAAFILHGSPVPTQMYLIHEIWNRTQDRDFLESFYPSLRQYYLFMAGSAGSSTTRELQSNLIRTWEYCGYNSAGWDDYPAQEYTLQKGDPSKTTCVAITAHLIRSAKILLAAADTLGLAADRAMYEKDIEIFSDALQRHAWDEESGYFSYVYHDDVGLPLEHLRHESGLNFNMGLDGMMPLVAGICTPEQEALMLQRLGDPERFWTRIGLSTVDQSAPYYRKEGYWNGAVWMPYQWFFWKTALDLGHGDFANQIGNTALDLWKAEVEASYYCFEHFLIDSGRGAGWHQFGGLSSPVLSWFSAYHCPGRLTTGFDIWVEEQCFSDHNRSFQGTLRLTSNPRSVTVLVNIQPGQHYTVLWDGLQIEMKEINPGLLQIEVPFESHTGHLEVVMDEAGN